VARQKKEEMRKQQEEMQQNARTKIASKTDYDKIFAERQAKAGIIVESKTSEDTKGMSKATKGIALEKAAEEGLANQLFGDEVEPKITLTSEKDYTNFAKKVGTALYSGNAPYHVEKFMKKVAEEMPKHCDSKHIKAVADYLMTLYNTKVKEERNLDKNVKKKAAALKGGGGKGYDRNNNVALINDVMGADDLGDYGNETGFTKEQEADFDFM